MLNIMLIKPLEVCALLIVTKALLVLHEMNPALSFEGGHFSP